LQKFFDDLLLVLGDISAGNASDPFNLQIETKKIVTQKRIPDKKGLRPCHLERMGLGETTLLVSTQRSKHR